MNAPNIQFRATITNRDNPELGTTALVDTDLEGHLTVPVALGAGNPFQQYTPAANATSTGPSPDDVPFLVFNNGSRFYRADVTIAATPTGLCQLVESFTSDEGTSASLCRLLRNFQKNQSNGNADAALLNAFHRNVVSRAGTSLTQQQADVLLGWADTL
jgi:hypothetical protein